MSSKHAGESRIADQALIDQVTAAAADMRKYLATPVTDRRPDFVPYWAGRALALLEQIGELGQ